MIINISRAKTFLLCKRKAFNHTHRRLEGPRSINLVDGSAFHKGVAHGLAKKNWGEAIEVARERFDQDKGKVMTLPGEEYVLEENWKLVQAMIEVYRKGFEGEEYEVIQPECQFDVALPGTEHQCLFVEHMISSVDGSRVVYGPPTPEMILEKRVDHLPRYQAEMVPHRLVGTTDAVVKWKGNIWLLEHKTSAIGGEQFWKQWYLDIQATAYIYGIRKATGLPVAGVIVNKIGKPSEGQVKNWNSKRKHGESKTIADYVSYEREAFLRTPKDLDRFEEEIIDLCNEWEERIVRGSFPLSPIQGACHQYNRVCDYHAACCSHDNPGDLEAMVRRGERDYVEEKVEKLVQIAVTKGEEGCMHQ